MKKYICPLTEKQEVLNLNRICDESAGRGSFSSPGNNPGSGGAPQGAPGRWF